MKFSVSLLNGSCSAIGLISTLLTLFAIYIIYNYSLPLCILYVGNMEMSCSSSQMPSPNVLCYSPGQYYHFRCDVQGSLRQVWKVDGTEMFRLGPSSTTADFFPTEPLNFFVHQVIVGDNPLQTTFVSYLWFNSSNFIPTTVACESATQNISITLMERYGT